jgi:hypothetical protein
VRGKKSSRKDCSKNQTQEGVISNTLLSMKRVNANPVLCLCQAWFINDDRVRFSKYLTCQVADEQAVWMEVTSHQLLFGFQKNWLLHFEEN